MRDLIVHENEIDDTGDGRKGGRERGKKVACKKESSKRSELRKVIGKFGEQIV